MPDIKTITVTLATDPTPRKFNGRVAWALNELVAAGERGCTPITHPGPRWSGYVHRLRQWPAAGFADTEIGCFMKPEVAYAATTVWA